MPGSSAPLFRHLQNTGLFRAPPSAPGMAVRRAQVSSPARERLVVEVDTELAFPSESDLQLVAAPKLASSSPSLGLPFLFLS